jgi:hypothetical protein
MAFRNRRRGMQRAKDQILGVAFPAQLETLTDIFHPTAVNCADRQKE